MKKAIIILLTIMMSTLVNAQEIKDGRGNVKATIDSLGIVKDANHHQVGQFRGSGNIHDANGDFIGKITGNNFYDMNGDYLGRINISTGEVFDLNDMKIGEIPDSKLVKDSEGNKIGTVSSAIDKKRLAAYYFFFFNDNI